MAISLRKARTIMRKALEKGRALELKPLSVVVLDAGGHLLAFEREDGAAPGRFEIARGKAYGAAQRLLGAGLADASGDRNDLRRRACPRRPAEVAKRRQNVVDQHRRMAGRRRGRLGDHGRSRAGLAAQRVAPGEMLKMYSC